MLAHLPAGAAVLDICCGTGRFTAQVQDANFEVVGLDASEKMLRYARENVPKVPLVLGDVRDFSLGRTFDAAYSVFESLNHIPDIPGLESAFACIRRHLRPGGLFVFDLNREDAFRVYWNNTHAIVEPAHVMVLRSEYNERTRVATCGITAFELDDNWTRSDFGLRQTCHREDDACNALSAAGFRDIELHDSRDLGMTGDISAARTFFRSIA